MAVHTSNNTNRNQMLGSAKIQSSANKMTLPTSLIKTGVFQPEKYPEHAYWAFDPELKVPILSNRDSLTRSPHRYLGSSRVQSDRSVSISKKLFHDYKGKTKYCRPVDEEIQLSYGEEICFVTDSASFDGEVRFYLVPPSELGYWLTR